MLIEIDTNILKSLNITINQLIYIKLLSENNPKHLKEFLEVSTISDSDLLHLVNEQILEPNDENVYNSKKCTLTKSFMDWLQNYKGDYFDKFYELYPISVTRTDGTKDYLRADIHRCRKLYNKIIQGSKLKHNNLMDCLRLELQVRRTNNSTGYMKRMFNWLNTEEWLVYEEMAKDIPLTNNETSYGNEIE